jgi:hypothetical protein
LVDQYEPKARTNATNATRLEEDWKESGLKREGKIQSAEEAQKTTKKRKG